MHTGGKFAISKRAVEEIKLLLNCTELSYTESSKETINSRIIVKFDSQLAMWMFFTKGSYKPRGNCTEENDKTFTKQGRRDNSPNC